jgi:hypothetical protein
LRGGRFGQQQETAPFRRDGFDARGGVLERRLARNRVGDLRGQQIGASAARHDIGPVHRHKDVAAALAIGNAYAENRCPIGRFNPRQTAIDQAVPRRIIRVDFQQSLAPMLGQRGGIAGAGHRVPLVAITPGVETQRPGRIEFADAAGRTEIRRARPLGVL